MKKGLLADPTPSADEPLNELIARREKDFARRHLAHLASFERTIRAPDARPVGLIHHGDPHLDDDGCDLTLLQANVKMAAKTDGMYSCTVGDMQNNWVGRLGRLYAHQNTTTRDSWRLTEWFIQAQKWAYLVRGNHDAWSGDGDPLDWIVRSAGIAVDAAHDARFRIVWPGNAQVRVWARHDFPGRSMWAKSHGQARAAVMGGYPADVVISGHRHCWESRQAERGDGSVYHAIQVGSYKTHDSYAAQLGFPDTKHGAAVVTVFDPRQVGPGRVQVFWDVATGCDYLRWIRSR